MQESLFDFQQEPELKLYCCDSLQISQQNELFAEYSNEEWPMHDRYNFQYLDTQACPSNASSMISLLPQALSKSSSISSKEQSEKKPQTQIRLQQQVGYSNELSPKKKRIQKKRSSIKTKKPGYPTKNFLAFFKNRHIQPIFDLFGQQIFEKYPKFQTIRNKWGINREDYQDIYKIPELQEHFQNFFASGELYRSLMKSQCNPTQKKIYISKLFRFQEAFRNKNFHQIN